MHGTDIAKNSYLPVISAQIQCINELASDSRQEKLSLLSRENHYCIAKAAPEIAANDDSMVLFQGKGRACHLFLNGYMASFLTTQG
ncbi:hypothetical protein VA7868_02809 [Vibrio aerogenes CECT 7868]|uniref:Uncharacterized protein n=1 Tax=Vibrio aerogenes CECT 7868 TaxID=1216006 RepID=A0A1M5ZJ82_9VIBR|nr:hypothetical protein [Vibrio aerogenes]SHI24204.1 hypothetical protein VA7868_02809 [Vibrio aerogenes CECT 7868]